MILDDLELNEKIRIQHEIMVRLNILNKNAYHVSDDEDFKSSGSFNFNAKQLQNRDRSRSSYIAQMRNIAHKLDYSKVSISRDANSGAPMVFPRNVSIPAKQLGKKDIVTMSDGRGGSRKIAVRYAVVDADELIASHDSSGKKTTEYAGSKGIMALNNGRVAGIKASYNLKKSDSYKKAMMQDIDAHGVSVKAIERVKKPVLVRLFDEASLEGIKDAGIASNEQVGATLSATEQGFTDSERLGIDDLSAFEGGDISSAANRSFVRRFISAIGGVNTAGDMIDAEGLLSSHGARRIEAALIAKAFGDKTILSDIVESSDSELKSLGNAIKSVSGQWAIMRDAANKGEIAPEVDITKNLIQALNIVRKSRQTNKSIYDLLGQSDMFSGETPEITKSIMRLFYQGDSYNRIRAAAKIATALNGYLEQAMKTSPSADMFGFRPSPNALLSQQQEKSADSQNNQRGIFDSINTFIEAYAMTLDGLDFAKKTKLQTDILSWFEALKLEPELLKKIALQEKIQSALALLSNTSKNGDDKLKAAKEKLKEIKKYMPESQYKLVANNLNSSEPEFVDIINRLHETISTMPVTYEQDGKGDDAVIYLHYFKGSSDVWITEKDVDGGVDQAFGVSNTGGTVSNGGYISITEITSAGLELDFHWRKKTIGEIKGSNDKTSSDNPNDKTDNKELESGTKPSDDYTSRINDLRNIDDKNLYDESMDALIEELEKIGKLDEYEDLLNEVDEEKESTAELLKKAQEVA